MATSRGVREPILRAQFQIGSCKGRVDYDSNERVFHPNDVPQKAKDARKWVQQSAKSHNLESHPPWVTQTLPGKYYCGTREAPWDGVKRFEDRCYAEIDVAGRLQDERMYKEKLIKSGGDVGHRNINPKWNASTFVEPVTTPALDEFFSISRAADGSASLRFGNESFEGPEPHTPPDGRVRTVTGTTTLGIGQPVVSTFDPTGKTSHHKPSRKTRLPIDYKSLVQRYSKSAETLRSEKERARAEAAERAQHESEMQKIRSATFRYPDKINFEGTKRMGSEDLEATLNATYTADSLTQYLEKMDATTKVGSMPLVQA